MGLLIQAAYHLLGLRTYFTCGPKETRAWTIHIGDTAPQASGVIHTDFERGFIKAETVGYDDLIANGSVLGAKEKGLYRQEGKDYVVQDGDVILFKFNVISAASALFVPLGRVADSQRASSEARRLAGQATYPRTAQNPSLRRACRVRAQTCS